MKRLQAFKFQLCPNGAQRQQMRRCAGSCRFVYNKGLALQKAHFEELFASLKRALQATA